MFSRFDTIHACDGQTNRQTDRRNWRGIKRYSIYAVARNKNVGKLFFLKTLKTLFYGKIKKNVYKRLLQLCPVLFSRFVDQSSPHAVREWLQFATPFSVWRYLVAFRRYSRSSHEVLWNVDVFGTPIFFFWGGEWAPNFWPNFINLDHLRTRSKVWWRLT